MAGRRAGTQSAGNRDRKIAIQRFTTTRDEYGAQIESWTTAFEAFAEVVPQQLHELFMSGAERTRSMNIFRIPYTTNIGEKDRVMYEGKAYDILELNEIGRRQNLEVVARSII